MVETEYGHESKSTVSKAYYTSGKLKSYQIASSESDHTVNYYESGAKSSEQLSVKISDNNGSYLKYRTEWYENGDLYYDYSGEINGDINYERRYGENGVLVNEVTNIAGVYSETGYYQSGKLQYKKSRDDECSQNYIALYYREDGSFEFKRTYVNNNAFYYDEYPMADGKQLDKYYSIDGVLTRTDISDGIAVERSTEFSYEGSVITNEHIHDYVNNTIEEYCYSTSGKLESYVFEQLDGLGRVAFYRFTVYYENGNPKTVEEGNENGVTSFTEYDEDGTVFSPIPE
jgi:hypothetical protein